MIKILFITSQLETGGTESHIYKLCTNLNFNHFVPYVLCIGPVHLSAEYAKKLLENNIIVLHIHLNIFKVHNILKIIKFINRNKITIIHSFLYSDVKWDILIYLFSKSKFLVTERRNIQHWRKEKKISIWELLRNNFSHTIIANSYEVSKITNEIEKIDIGKIKIIHNGYIGDYNIDNLKTYHIKQFINFKENDFIICNVANLKTIKRQEDIIIAIHNLKSIGFKNIKLILVGGNHQNYQQNLERLIIEFELKENVFFAGLIENPKEYYKLADLMVLSSAAEGFSNAILESLFYGTPVIATNVGGNTDIITSNFNGYLYEVGNTTQLSDLLLKFYKLKKSEKKMFSINAIQSSKEFSIESMIGKYTALYNSILAN